MYIITQEGRSVENVIRVRVDFVSKKLKKGNNRLTGWAVIDGDTGVNLGVYKSRQYAEAITKDMANAVINRGIACTYLMPQDKRGVIE